MKEVTICYIGGGSKNWAQKYFSDLVLQDKICGTIRLFDIDKKAALLNQTYFNKLIKDNEGKVNTNFKCEVIDTIEDALTGSDIVIISILPYKLTNMIHDVHFAQRYGVYQPVGDTVGVGGYSRALRTIPTFKYFGLKIKECCPNAWVINYTNPMSMCTNALFYAFPEIKAFGCCHEVFSSQKLICGIMDMYNALDNEGQEAFMRSDYNETLKALKRAGLNFNAYKHPKTDRHEIYTNVQGVNHFTFINKASYKGEDLMPLYKAFVPMFKKHTNKNIVKFDLYEKYGIFGAAGDRHLSEFVPEDYLPLNKSIYTGKNGFKLTTVYFRIARDIFRRCQLYLEAHLPFKIKPKASGEEGTLQLIALQGLGDLVSNVNILNNGQAPDLPLGTSVETNAKFTNNKIEAINSGNISSKVISKRVNLHASNQKDYVKAIFDEDKNKLREVFKRDPQVARLKPLIQDRLFEDLIKRNKNCLEDWILNK